METDKPKRGVKLLDEDPEEINFSDDNADIPLVTSHKKRQTFDGLSLMSS